MGFPCWALTWRLCRPLADGLIESAQGRWYVGHWRGKTLRYPRSTSTKSRNLTRTSGHTCSGRKCMESCAVDTMGGRDQIPSGAAPWKGNVKPLGTLLTLSPQLTSNTTQH